MYRPVQGQIRRQLYEQRGTIGGSRQQLMREESKETTCQNPQVIREMRMEREKLLESLQ